MNDLLEKLAAPFPPERISWRVGPTNNRDNPTSGIALAYIDARDVQDRLDAVCGTNWQSRYPHAAQKTVCEIGIKIGDEWVWRSDGAGDTDMEAEKGSLSDAFKRAAVKWGIGRYLYDIESPWVDVVKKGAKSVVIADKEFARLQRLLPGSRTPPVVDNLERVAENMQRGGTEKKNPPGRSKAVSDVRDLCREVMACSDADQLMILLNQPDHKRLAFTVCQTYPRDWMGQEDNSGLAGVVMLAAKNLKCTEAETWVHKAEQAVREANSKHAAE